MASNPERERRIRECLTEVMRSHRDPKDADYNQCDDDPCMWCDNAQKVLDSAPSEQEAQSREAPVDAHREAGAFVSEVVEICARAEGFGRYQDSDWNLVGIAAVVARLAERLAREAQPQATKPDGWRRIESAPKDGTRVLVWQVWPGPNLDWINLAGQARATIAWWDSEHRQWIGHLTGDPTHWQPLPAPPSESQPASPAADTELADMRELYEQAKNDPRREILTDFAAWLTTQPGTLHVGASHSSPAVLEVALRYMVERAADTEEGQTERIEGSATGRDGCFSFYASGRSFLSGGAPVYRATLLVHRERCTDSQSGGSDG